MRLQYKLLLGFIAVAALVGLVSLIAIQSTRTIISGFNFIVNQAGPEVTYLERVKGSAARMGAEANSYLIFTDENERVSEIDEFEEYWQALQTGITTYDELAADELEHSYAVALLAVGEQLYQAGQAVFTNINSESSDAEIAAAIERVEEAEQNFSTSVDALIAQVQEDLEVESGGVNRDAANALTLIIVAAIGAVVLAVAIALVVSNMVTKPLGTLMNVTQKMVGGDYTQRVNVMTKDELGQLATSFNRMAGAVQEREQGLQDLNTTLDKRVQQRTVELEKATREAKEASRLKDEFLAIMSHELRTPLNAIIGFLGILGMSGKLDENSLHMTRRARSNAERLLSLINDILDISRIESGRLQLVPTSIPLNVMVDRVRGQMSVLAEQKNLAFEIEVDKDLPKTVYADEDALLKVMTNLLGNAFKFTDQGNVNLRLTRQDQHWIIQVADTGIGIPPHMHEIIFERFRQVDGSSKRAYGGSGLGLAIVRQYVLAMGGTISVASEPGQGSTFTVTFPLETTMEGAAGNVPATLSA